MGYQELLNDETYGVHRGKLNSQLSELYNTKIESSQVLLKGVDTSFFPSLDGEPANKFYVDSSLSTFISIYDPQEISGDAFLRSNHTGTQPPASIATDPLNRFVTDTEKASWNSKEPAIGSKKTAFNKDFGTIVGTVAQGNHTHNKSEIGLGNVDNTSDVNKPISTATQAALDLKSDFGADLAKARFIPQSSHPTHEEGTVFYDEHTNSFALFNQIAAITQAVGQEHFVRVYNNTGSTIVNGTAVYQTGGNTSFNCPTIGKAIGTSFDKATVLGITTHDIPNNTVGFITLIGVVNNIDTSSYAPGTVLYLSDSVLGGLTDIPPDVVTSVGVVIIQNATTGSLYVSINNNVVFPNSIGILQAASAPTSLSAGITANITTWATSIDFVIQADKTTGYIRVANDGVFRINSTMSISCTSIASGDRTITVEVYNVTGSTVVATSSITIAKDATSGSRSFNFPAELNANNDYVVRFTCPSAVANLSFVTSSFDIESIRIG